MAKMIFDSGTGTVLELNEDILIVDSEELNEYMQGDEDVSQWNPTFKGENGEELLSDEDHTAQRCAIAVGVSLTDSYQRMAQRAASVQSVLEQGAKDFMAHGWDTLYNSLPDEVRSEYALVNPFTDI